MLGRTFGWMVAALTVCSACGAELADEAEQTAQDMGDVSESAPEQEALGESRAALTVPSFALLSEQSGKALTGGSLSAGTLVTQTRLVGTKGTPNQRWVSVNLNFSPESKPNLCLQPESSAASARLRLQSCNGSPLQGWKLSLVPQNGVNLTRWTNLATGLLLDNGGTSSEGAAAIVRPFSGLASQKFRRLF